MDACREGDRWNCEEIRVSLAVGLALTVDQPPLAVGVRFPLCPPIFSMATGPIGPTVESVLATKRSSPLIALPLACPNSPSSDGRGFMTGRSHRSTERSSRRRWIASERSMAYTMPSKGIPCDEDQPVPLRDGDRGGARRRADRELRSA